MFVAKKLLEIINLSITTFLRQLVI